MDSLAAMIRYREWREEPEDELVPINADKEKVRAIFDTLRQEGRLGLGEMEAREVLMAYGLTMPDYRLATSAEEAARFRGGDRLPGSHEDRLAGHPAQVRHRRREGGRGRPGGRRWTPSS